MMKFTRCDSGSQKAIYTYSWAIPNPCQSMETFAQVLGVALATAPETTILNIEYFVGGERDGYKVEMPNHVFDCSKQKHDEVFTEIDSMIRATWPDLYKDVKPFNMDARL